MAPLPDRSPTHRALVGLDRAVYLLDRGLAPPAKSRAFRRAAELITLLDTGELERRCADGTITELAGIGPSTGSVICDSVLGRPSQYLERLDATSTQVTTIGAELRAALAGDLHCHTAWSDGAVSIEHMARAAMALGHEYLAITDHSPRLTIAHGLDSERLAEQGAEIVELNHRLAPFRVLRGMEVDILLDGGLDLAPDDLLALDIVVASVHSKLAMPPDEMTRRLVHAVSSTHVDILGHCTGRQILGTPRAPSRFDPELVFSACASAGTAVEINCRPERRDPPDELLRIAIDAGCLVSINTDAHAPGQMEWQPWGCDTATSLGLRADRVINTWEIDRLLGWRSDRTD